MRLFLLPISTRQSLLYCHRLNRQLTGKSTWADKISTRATTIWLGWEKRESGWQKKVTEYGNKLLKRLPHEEWSLKSIPPLNARRKGEEIKGKEQVCVEYPDGFVDEVRVQGTLKRLGADEKQAFHMKWCLGSIVEYLIYHSFIYVFELGRIGESEARSGSRHLEFLLENKLTKLNPSSLLRMAYTEATLDVVLQQLREEVRIVLQPSGMERIQGDPPEQMLLSRSSGKVIAEQLEIPAVAVEIERAVWQVERGIRAQ